MEQAAHAIRNVADVDYETLQEWIPVKSTNQAFARIGVDTQILDAAKKKNAKTGTSVWDLINGVTHFATHDNGIQLTEYDRRRLQVVAGQMLTKIPDMSNQVRTPF